MNISKCEGNDTCSKYKCRKSPKAPESNVVHLSIVTFKAVYGIKLKKKKKRKHDSLLRKHQTTSLR